MLKYESTQSEITVTIHDKVGEPIPFHIDHATSNGGEVIIERDATQHEHYLIFDKKTGRVYLPHLGHRIIVDAMFMTTMELVLISYSAEARNAIDDLLINRKSVSATLKKYPGLYDNFEVALVAMALKGTPLQSLKMFSEPLQRALKHVVMAAVKQDGGALRHVSDDLRADKEVVMAAVKQDGGALIHASDDLRADKEVVMAAVHQNGMALKYASNTLRAHKDVVATAIANMPGALQHASEDLCMTIS